MNWKRWKLGLLIATCQAILVAGSTSLAGGHWKEFAAAFCSSAALLWTNWLKQHPIEEITSDTTQITKQESK